MLKIYEKIWYVKSQRRPNDLSYMTYYEDNAACRLRQQTGLKWAGGKSEDGVVLDNTPVSGFQIDGSVSRWTTQNKLFRVRDPRGFTVKIPAGNLAKILECSTVTKGEIMDECVWGRDGGDHLLIPKQSELYEEAVINMEKLGADISIKDVAVGEIIEAHTWGSISKVIYLGQFKGKFRGTLTKRNFGYWSSKNSTKILADLGEHTDKKWWHAFARESDLKRLSESNSYFSIDQRRTVKVTARTGQRVDMDVIRQLREKVKVKYVNTSEARKVFCENDIVKTKSGRVEADFIGAEWR